MKRFDTFGAYMFDLLFAPLKRGKRAANQFFIFFKVIGRIFDGMKKDAFRLRDDVAVQDKFLQKLAEVTNQHDVEAHILQVLNLESLIFRE